MCKSTGEAFFRLLAALFKHESGAQSVAGLSALALVIYAGFSIPQPSMIGALRWITYINVRILFNGACFLILRPFSDKQPVKYGFESLIANEFHTIHANCATLVPQGSGYENVQLANQVCATVGAVAGETTVNGNRFLELAYEYSYSNAWMVSQISFLYHSFPLLIMAV